MEIFQKEYRAKGQISFKGLGARNFGNNTFFYEKQKVFKKVFLKWT